ncbi:MAG: hypothetical protein WCG66_12270 [bacterium]
MKNFLLILLLTPALAWAAEYPLKTCVVSGEKLGEMGEPFVFVYEGTEVRLCCEMCKPKFDKNPAKYLEKLQPQSGSSK